MTPTLTQILRLIDQYHRYLAARGIAFANNGAPIMKRAWYLTEFPERIIPYRDRKNRKLVADPAHTVLCFYCADTLIFRRMQHPLADLDEYRRFMGVIGANLTVTEDMDIEWQRAILLLNRLFDAVLAVNGIKLVQNLRVGSPTTLDTLTTVPEGVLAASGTLGCPATKPGDLSYTLKLNTAKPGGVMIYGKKDPLMEQQLDALGIHHHRYDDTHTLYKKRRQGRSE
ncbi:hypothetical protein CS006_00485 [Bifidobacterium primatium]|uniref:Uncharacterized protein n=1 Tax=Bifidobacterium primatium TaxID=2045438 RepID=A0A2M9HA75_9BIFI|nr:DUF4417 domain-containing protein [Bifidobacterium primatium]PJM73709.1 hypothetical protein CS006_00485 [Bifidobacterium primatium]